MGEQADQIERVSERIGRAVLAFFSQRIPDSFCAEDLRDYIRQNVGQVAPGSPDRIMRDMRQKGRIDYKVTSRKDSQYLIVRAAQ